MTTTTKGERRVKSRKRPISLVYVELAGGNGGMMKDLSAEGFSLRAMMPLRLGEKTPFTFSLSEAVRIEGEGQVLWVEENGRVAGIQFTKVSTSALEQIESWLIRPETPPKREHVGGTAKAVRDTTLEELREEIHTVPPRSEGAAPVERAEPPVERPAPPPVVERTAPPVIEAPLARVVAQHEPRVAEEPTSVASRPPEPAPVEAALPSGVEAPVQPPMETRVAPTAETPAPPPVQETAPPPPPVVESPVTRPVEPAAAPPAPAVPTEAAAPAPPVVPAPTPTPEPVFARTEPTVLEAPRARVREEKPVAEVPAPQTTAPMAEPPVEEKAIPALPRLRLDPPAAEPPPNPAEFVPPSTPFTPPAPAKREKWPLYVDADPRPETQTPEAAPHAMPDISSVLMQPTASSSHAVHAASLDAIASWDGETAPRESRGMSISTVIATMTVLALLAALYVFHQEVGQSLIWLGQTMGGAFQSEDQKPAASNSSGDSVGNSSPAQNTSAATAPASGQDPSSSGQAAGAGSEKAADATSPAANPAAVSPPAPSPVTNGNPAPSVAPPAGMPPATTAPGPEPGQVEYSEAMQILRGKNADKAQLTEVSRLLWVSVEKGNPSAELALAEMYWEGRGVARNCDQTLVLLTAAARKGSVEAQKRLQEFQRQGCE